MVSVTWGKLTVYYEGYELFGEESRHKFQIWADFYIKLNTADIQSASYYIPSMIYCAYELLITPRTEIPLHKHTAYSLHWIS